MKNKIEFIGSCLPGWALFEAGYVHTDGLTEAEANEMLARYRKCFPEIEFFIQYISNR